MHCHGTKCPLLTACFFFLSFSLRYFSPGRGYRRVLKFCGGFLVKKKIRFGVRVDVKGWF